MTKFTTLETPEGKKFVFKIPDKAKTDSRGFYKIDEDLKKENPDIDFLYLSHDLNYRGINSQNDFYENNGIRLDFPKYTVKHLRDPIKHKSDSDTANNWKETADSWLFIINDQTFEYYTGVGHRVAKTPYDKDEFNRLKNANLTEFGFFKFLAISKAIAPSIESLFYSLVMDSDALECSFSEWCDMLGYDTDSRNAFEVYTACQNSAEKLRKLGFNLNELRKYYEDF